MAKLHTLLRGENSSLVYEIYVSSVLNAVRHSHRTAKRASTLDSTFMAGIVALRTMYETYGRGIDLATQEVEEWQTTFEGLVERCQAKKLPGVKEFEEAGLKEFKKLRKYSFDNDYYANAVKNDLARGNVLSMGFEQAREATKKRPRRK